MIKRMLKSTPLYGLFQRIRQLKQARHHRILHNENAFFYTLSPALLIGILRAFKVSDRGGGYYEFGLFKGFSFWFAEQIQREYGTNFYFYGFDSFEGLPESKVDVDPIYWAEGNYATSYDSVLADLKSNGTDLSKIKLFKGFFSKEYFDELKRKEHFKPVAICVIDSDIYESCVFVLDFIKDYLVTGSVLLFDDYNAFGKDDHHGERRALWEFEQSNPSFRKEHLFDFGWHGVAFKIINI